MQSNVGETGARSVLFRGGDLDQTPDHQHGTAGVGSHSYQHLLSIDLAGYSDGLVTAACGKAADHSSMMTVDTVPNPERERRVPLLHRRQPDVRITARGRRDNPLASTMGREYVQATSWHDAYKVVGGVTQGSGGNAATSPVAPGC